VKPGVRRAISSKGDGRIDALFAGVDAQDFDAAFDVGDADVNLTVEAAGTHERRVQNVDAVGRRDDDDAGVVSEAVHFDQELVQGLFAFVVTAAQSGSALAADGVDFVDEEDARGVLFGGFEHVADAAGADADEHFQKVRAGDEVEGNVRFAGDGSGDQRFAGAGRTDQKHAFGNAGAQFQILFRVFQEVDDFFEFGFFFIRAGDVVERRFLSFGKTGARFAEIERLFVGVVVSAGHVDHEHDDGADQKNGEDDVDQVVAGGGNELVGDVVGGVEAATAKEVGVLVANDRRDDLVVEFIGEIDDVRSAVFEFAGDFVDAEVGIAGRRRDFDLRDEIV
jgi:hypothetical protein